MTRKKIAQEILLLASELVAADPQTSHEMVKLGPDLFLTIYHDHSIALVRGGRPVVMLDATQAKKLSESIH